jgi:hypothetical protein
MEAPTIDAVTPVWPSRQASARWARDPTGSTRRAHALVTAQWQQLAFFPAVDQAQRRLHADDAYPALALRRLLRPGNRPGMHRRRADAECLAVPDCFASA